MKISIPKRDKYTQNNIKKCLKLQIWEKKLVQSGPIAQKWQKINFLTKRKFCVPKWNFGFITYYTILFVLCEPNKAGPGSLGCDFALPQKLREGNAPEPSFITY